MCRVGLVCVVLAVGLALGAGGARAELAAMEPEEASRALKAGLLVRLAEDMELDDSRAAELLHAYRDHALHVEALRARQAELRQELMHAVGDDAESGLERLIETDLQLREAREAAARELGQDLAPAERARLYLLLSTLEEHVQSLLEPGKPFPAAHAELIERGMRALAPPADPEEAIRLALQGWARGLQSQDLDRAMLSYSEHFEHEEYGDRAGMREFLQQAKDLGYLSGMEVTLEDAEVRLRNGTAQVRPIELHGNFGQLTTAFTLRRENGHWRIIRFEMDEM